MARMYPSSIEVGGQGEGPTEGEYRLFSVLRDSLLPDADFCCWYEMALGEAGRRRWPDFVIFGRWLGLVVVEVKDWRANQITEFNKGSVVFTSGKRSWERKNPERQAKAYGDRLQSELQRHGLARRGAGIPIGRLVAFPFITRAEYQGGAFDQVIPADVVLLADDLDPADELFVGRSAESFRERLEKVQPFPCPTLTSGDIEKIEHVLWPNRVHLPARAADEKTRFQSDVKYLDAHQARVARNLQRGHQLLKGPPGSGKTLVLAHRCKFLSLYDPGVERILFVCFNIALASYLKRLLQEQELSTGPTGVQVHHFFELCSKVLADEVPYNYEPLDKAYDYYRTVVELAVETLDSGESKIDRFDAILVDEGQDFDDNMFRVIRGLLREDGDLVIALDTEQDLYHAKRRLQGTWKSLGFDVQGRVRSIDRVYRSTPSLRQFAKRFLGTTSGGSPAELTTQGILPFKESTEEVQGEAPELTCCGDRASLLGAVTRQVRQATDRAGYNRAEIAILYDDKVYGVGAGPTGFSYGEETIGRDLYDALESVGVPVQWVSESTAAKQYFDVTRDSVVLSSVHSAKGLDFELVLLVHPGWPGVPRQEWRARLGPTYVAITRAKHRLIVFYEKEDDVVRRMIETAATRTAELGERS